MRINFNSSICNHLQFIRYVDKYIKHPPLYSGKNTSKPIINIVLHQEIQIHQKAGFLVNQSGIYLCIPESRSATTFKLTIIKVHPS